MLLFSCNRCKMKITRSRYFPKTSVSLRPTSGLRPPASSLPKRGFTALEMTAAIFMLLIALAAFVQIAFVSYDQQRLTQAQAIAHEQLQSVLETVPASFTLQELGVTENLDVAELAKNLETRFLTEEVKQTLARTLPEARVDFETFPLEGETQINPSGFVLKAVFTWNEGVKRPHAKMTFVRLISFVPEGGNP